MPPRLPVPRPSLAHLSLASQLGLQIGGLILLLLLGLSAFAYVSLSLLAAQALPGVLRETVALRAAQQGQGFRQAQDSVQRLRAAWLERAAALPLAQVAPRFTSLFAQSSDGLWRLRPERVDTERAPTFYLQPGPHRSGLDDDVRRRAVVSYELLRERGPALVPPLFSAYVDFIEKGLMVYAPGIDWGRSATPATNNLDYPTMRGSDPRRNPRREVFWTPVYFDGEARTWMVSVIAPLDWQGRWVGTVGHDLNIDSLLGSMDGQGTQLGSQQLILSGSGELIAHPQLRERIAQADGQLALKRLHDPLLDAVYGLIREQSGPGAHVAATADGRFWVAWQRIEGPDWWSVSVLPQDLVEARLRAPIAWILMAGLLSLALALWWLRRVIRRRVQQPLGRLSRAVQRLSAGQEPGSTAGVAAADLARLSGAFDGMVQQLAEQRRAEQAQAELLQREVLERRAAEAAVRELNESLELRVQARTRELQLAQDELVQKETLASLGGLVAGVAHELNTPLGNALIAADTADAALHGLAASLQAPAVRRGELLTQLARAQEGLTLALGNVQRGVTLVQDFKQVAVDRASLRQRRFDLREVCEEVVGLMRYALRGGVEVELALPAGIELDGYPGAFGQVLTNLLQNALLHAFAPGAPGRIRVSLEAEPEPEPAAPGARPQRLRLSIADDGCGIPAVQQPQVFKPFFTTKLGRGGSGLGLHIVYNLVTNVLGGRVELYSEPGQGTRFVLDLPRVAPGAALD